MIRFIFLIIFIHSLVQAEPISPIPLKVNVDIQKAKLGKKLFLDTQFSKDGSVACISCHDIFNGGADGRVVSLGVGQRLGNIQAPTLFNSIYNFKQFWNGRANDLYEQIDGPVHNPVEMSMTNSMIEQHLNGSKEYKQDLKKIYHTVNITYKMFVDAIVEFEKALITPNSKFDKYLRGEEQLSSKEQKGYFLFKQLGCITCHNGINIGANSFQKMGTFIEYQNQQQYPDRYNITHDKDDINVFKVPSLRNISRTAPYFHDGSRKTLSDAIRAMAHYNLGIPISQEDINDLIVFLKTLDGETPAIVTMP